MRYASAWLDNGLQDRDAQRQVPTNASRPALTIVLPPDEAKRFAALTERGIGKRLLVMIGEEPLTAPRIMTPIDTGSMVIESGREFGGQAEADKVERDLDGSRCYRIVVPKARVREVRELLAGARFTWGRWN